MTNRIMADIFYFAVNAFIRPENMVEGFILPDRPPPV
jgi:hypothetical protein